MHFSKKKRTRTVTKKETDEFLESGWGETKKNKGYYSRVFVFVLKPASISTIYIYYQYR